MVFNRLQNERREFTPEQRTVYKTFWKFKDGLLDRALVDARLCPLSFRVLTYTIRAKYADGKYKYLHTPDSQFFEGPKKIAKELGVALSPVKRALKELELTGYLVLVAQGRRAQRGEKAT